MTHEKKEEERGTDVLKEDLEDTTGLLVDEAGDTLHTATTSKTTNGLVSERRVRQRSDSRFRGRLNLRAW